MILLNVAAAVLGVLHAWTRPAAIAPAAAPPAAGVRPPSPGWPPATLPA